MENDSTRGLSHYKNHVTLPSLPSSSSLQVFTKMAGSQVHVRSISLPSRLHPVNSPEFESQLKKLVLSTAAPLSSYVIQSGLVELSKLYASMENTPALLHYSKNSIEDSLSTSLELLDSCTTILELVQTIRETIQALQSALRRKGLDSTLQADVASYLSIRKKMNKSIAKSLKTIKKLENKNGLNGCCVHDITVAMFKGILMFLSWSSTTWSSISKLTKLGKHHEVFSELGCVDFEVSMLNGKVRNCDRIFDVQTMQRGLQNGDACAQGIEASLEILFRELVRNRVTLLNVITHQ